MTRLHDLWLTAPLAFLLLGAGPACPDSELDAPCKAVAKGQEETAISSCIAAIDARFAAAPDDACRLRLFRHFQKAQTALASGFSDAPLFQSLSSDPNDPKHREAAARVAKLGLVILAAEGNCWTEPDQGWWADHFGAHLPAGWGDYLRLKARVQTEGLLIDGGLALSWDALQARVGAWSAFLARYPDFDAKAEADQEAANELQVLASGSDNSPITQDLDGKEPLRPEVKAAYEALIKRGDGSRSFVVISGYYEALKKHGFRLSPEARDYLKAHDILAR